MAPELFNTASAQQHDLEKIDVFACGVVLFTLFMGFPPY